MLLFFGPGIDRLGGLEVQAIGQKIIVYSSIANVSIQAYGMRRYLVRTPDMGGTVEAGATKTAGLAHAARSSRACTSLLNTGLTMLPARSMTATTPRSLKYPTFNSLNSTAIG